MNNPGREHGFGTGLLAHLERGREGLPAAPAPMPAPAPEPERVPDPLAERQQALEAREQRLAERERELEAAYAELVRREERLRHAPQPPQQQGPPPEYIRARAEREAELVWAAFSAGLVAETPDGRPDHAARIAAAQALLAELRLDPPGAAFADELARRRELREAGL
jgi:hypothetical protein